MVIQKEFVLGPFKRGFHLVTDDILHYLDALPEKGLLHLFIKHTSAGLAVNENCDPDVLLDFESIFEKMVPENLPFLRHTIEGPDDMPAHIKSVLTGHSIQVAITDHKLNLGTWQGIYLCEFRYKATGRHIVATIIG